MSNKATTGDKKKPSSKGKTNPQSSPSFDDLTNIQSQVYGTFSTTAAGDTTTEGVLTNYVSCPADEFRKEGERTRRESEDFHKANIRKRLDSLEDKYEDPDTVEEAIVVWFVGKGSIYDRFVKNMGKSNNSNSDAICNNDNSGGSR